MGRAGGWGEWGEVGVGLGGMGKAYGPFKFTQEPLKEPQGPHGGVPTPAGPRLPPPPPPSSPRTPPWTPRTPILTPTPSRTRTPQVSTDAEGRGGVGGFGGGTAPLRRPPPLSSSGERVMGSPIAHNGSDAGPLRCPPRPWGCPPHPLSSLRMSPGPLRCPHPIWDAPGLFKVSLSL